MANTGAITPFGDGRRRRLHGAACLVAAAAVAFIPHRADGQTVRTWLSTTPSSGTFQWVIGSNWSSGTAPQASTTAYFAAPSVTGTINIEFRAGSTGTNSVKGITFDYADSTRIYSTNTNRGLRIGSDGITLTGSSGPVAFSPQGAGLNLLLESGTQTWRNDSAGELLLYAAPNRGSSTQLVTTAPSGTGSTLVIDGSGPVRFERPLIGDVGREISLEKQGSGLLTLDSRGGSNLVSTFSGGFALKGGTVALNYPQALGLSTLTIEIGTLINTSGSAVTLSNTNAQVWNGDFEFRGSNALNLGTGTVTLGATPTLTIESSTLTVGGPITGGFGLVKTGDGTLRLTAVNTFSGTTRIDGGILDVNNVNQALRNSVLDPSGSGTLANYGTAPWFGGLVNFSGFALSGTVTRLTLNPQEGANQTYDALPAGGAATIGLTKAGPGTMIFNGTSTWSGTTRVNEGVLQVDWLAEAGEASPLGTSGTLVLGSGATAGTLRYSGTGHATSRAIELAGSAGGGLDASGSGTVAFIGGVSGTTSGVTLTLTGTNTGSNYIESIGGAGVNVAKTGVGTWVLGTNTFTGTLSIGQGTLIAAGNAPSTSTTGSGVFGTQDSGRPVIGAATDASGTAALLLSAGFSIARGIDVPALVSGTQESILGGVGPGSSTFGTSSAVYMDRPVTLAADAGHDASFDGSWYALTGTANAPAAYAINVGTADLTGTVSLRSALPETVPALNVRRGTLRLDGGGNETTPMTVGSDLGAATVDLTGQSQALQTLAFGGTAGLVVPGGVAGELRLAGASPTVTAAAGAGHRIESGIALDSAATFDVTAAAARLAVTGAITNGTNGARGLTKSGSGTLALSGSSSYTGATAVNAGTLAVDGILAATAVTIASGATLTGTGTLGGFTSILGTHSPGASPGIETFASGLSYGSSSTLVWELIANTSSGTSRGVLFDGVNLTGGALSIASGATLSLVFNLPGSTVNWNDGFWGSEQSWTVIDISGSGSWNSSLFTTLSVGVDSTNASLESKRPGSSFQVVESDGDLLLQYVFVIPEPGTLALAAIGLAAAAALARRRAGRRG